MVLRISVGLVAVIAVLLTVIATRPDTFHVARTATIAAPADTVFAHLVDLHRWGAWNPFEKGEPDLEKAFAGPEAGVGSSYHYVGKRIGEGRMTIIETTPGERVAVRAEFITPFPATNLIEFTLVPAAEGVTVTWAMSGENTFLGKAISLVMSMDRMVGTEFEKGLAELKRISEAEGATSSSGPRRS